MGVFCRAENEVDSKKRKVDSIYAEVDSKIRKVDSIFEEVDSKTGKADSKVLFEFYKAGCLAKVFRISPINSGNSSRGVYM